MTSRIIALIPSEVTALRNTLSILLKGGEPKLTEQDVTALQFIYDEITRSITPGERRLGRGTDNRAN